jgi:MYXO-CTERM domain-containing protein
MGGRFRRAMARASRGRRAGALLFAGLLTTPAHAGGPWMCLGPGQLAPGPCQLPEPARFLPATGSAPAAVAANFGLLLPAAGGAWQFVCDDGYGAAPPDHLWRAPGGGFLVAGARGLLRSDDGCEWSPVEGEPSDRKIEDVLVEPGASGRVWALGAEPGAVYLSTDGGRRFVTQGQIAPALAGAHLRAAPAEPTRLYVTAGLAERPPGAWISRDAGRTWTAQPPATTLPGPLAVLAFAPDDADTVYFKVTEPEGDELWKSADGGRTLARVLKLSDFELMAGLAFGPAPAGQAGPTLYVAGRAPIVIDGVPPGRLYLSRDGGGTWQPPVHAPALGPAYRCLEFSAGKLFACGGGEAAGESFLVGVSGDEGRSWTPLVRLADVHGPRACVRDRCQRTELWLCESYGQCTASDGGAAPTDAADAAADVIADASSEPGAVAGGEGGCGCAVGSRTPSVSMWVLALLALLMRRRPLR